MDGQGREGKRGKGNVESQLSRRAQPSCLCQNVPPLKLSPPLPRAVALRAMSGLRNEGNTCFLNATLQALAASRTMQAAAAQMVLPPKPPRPALRARLLAKLHLADDERRRAFALPVWKELKSLLALLRADNADRRGAASASRLAAAVDAAVLAGRAQQDAHEAYLVLVQKLEEEMAAVAVRAISLAGGTAAALAASPRRLRLPVAGLVGGMWTCAVCGFTSTLTCQQVHDISVAVPASGRLPDAVRRAMADVPLDGVRCDVCVAAAERAGRPDAQDVRVRATKSTRLVRVPPLLCIHVQRVTISPTSGTAVKDSRPLAFPLQLDLSATLGSLASADEQLDLVAVVCHRGSASSGHYIAYRQLSDGRWALFSDAVVRPVPIETVLADQAYMLLYERHAA